MVPHQAAQYPDWTLRDITFRSGEKVERPDVKPGNAVSVSRGRRSDFHGYDYLRTAEYADINNPGQEGFLKDGQRCKVLLYQGKPLDIDIPLTLTLEVTDTEPGAKGRYGKQCNQAREAGNRNNGAGADFCKYRGTGSKVDTRTKEYLGRE